MTQELITISSQILIPILVAVITYIIAKKQLTNAGVTQFRQNWIDNLRDAISLFIAKAEMITLLDMDDDDNYFDHFKELAQMQYKIELMLNPDESDHSDLVDIMKEIRETIHDEDLEDQQLDDTVDRLIENLLKVSKKVLKREWVVVKKGK